MNTKKLNEKLKELLEMREELITVNESIYEPGTEGLQFSNILYYIQKSLIKGIKVKLEQQERDLRENPDDEIQIKIFYKSQIKELLDNLTNSIERLNSLFKELYGE